MLTLSGITKAYGRTRIVPPDATLQVNREDRIGFGRPERRGKTTLFSMFWREKPDEARSCSNAA